jgi:hypothetical protein
MFFKRKHSQKSISERGGGECPTVQLLVAYQAPLRSAPQLFLFNQVGRNLLESL